MHDFDGTEIAIIGMAGRFPGARNLDDFWHNLRDGTESIRTLDDDELLAHGIDAATLRDPTYVKAAGILDDIEYFDATFFAMNHREAQLTDPQQRFFLECAWEALENAGYHASHYPGAIGVFGGATINTYLLFNIGAHPDLIAATDPIQLDIGNAGDYLTTRVSYKLNLRGPSHLVQSACSTALVAVHLACQNLLIHACDIALAGGVSINPQQRQGYRSLEGGITAPDGHCRAFDARAAGTIFTSGAGVIVLKRLSDALADGDHIRAIIRGSAINNDGALKAGYTAPSVEGQAAVISEALGNAGISADTISYIEAHGTATTLGDPIEVQALTHAFRESTTAQGFCALGAVKTNIGHTGAAAGIAGLIKTVLALEHHQIPPSLHFEHANPDIDFPTSPFYVNTHLTDWQPHGGIRRAGVSAFGVGGTNAHVILEEAPPSQPSSPGRPWQLLSVSAKTITALDSATANLAHYLHTYPNIDMSDVAYTLHVGRATFAHRGVLVCRDRADALNAITVLGPQRVFTSVQDRADRPVAFLFPGQGAHYLGMAQELYVHEPHFRATVDHCAALLHPHLGLDVRTIIFSTAAPDECAAPKAPATLDQTWLTQPALFVIAYALAQLWSSWGITPRAMIGHSIGEYVAACLAEVFTLDDALALVAARGRLMQTMPSGTMLALPLSEAEIAPLLPAPITIAAINGPRMCVVAGPSDALIRFEAQLAVQGIEGSRLHTSHAFHSPMMDAVVAPFRDQVAHMALRPPRIPFISNISGTWISDTEATDPTYWARQLRAPVRFADGLATLLADPSLILLEVGPGVTLGRLAAQHPRAGAERVILASLRHPREQHPDVAFALLTLGKLWLAGAVVDWDGLYAHERRRRIPLPTYPFERRRYWIDARTALSSSALDDAPAPLPAAALPPPSEQHARPTLPTAYVTPRTDLEAQIANLWEAMLGVDRVGIHDDFFALGGHSLLALQLTARLRETFHVELPLGSFFEQATVAGLAEVIAQYQPGQDDELDAIARILAEVEGLAPEELFAELPTELRTPAVVPAPMVSPPVVVRAPAEPLVQRVGAQPRRAVEFSLCYFSSDEGQSPDDKYRLMLEGARLADHYGFSAIWTPERHFHPFGGLYPSPATLNAALAMVTERIRLRAGSIVLPLHHPVRIAEEWSVLDNLSQGRVDIAVASGWHADDFVFAPDSFATRREVLLDGVAMIRRLWRGESVTLRGGAGKAIDVQLFPRPVQPDLAIWMTAANNPDTFVRAGEIGAHVLSALIELSVEQLGERIALYRAALAQHGYDPHWGRVTVMLHTFVGADDATVREQVRQPFYGYVRSHGDLLRNLARTMDIKIDLERFSARDEEALLAFAFERYYANASLMGTPEKCMQLIERLRAIGVDEVACLIDFGVAVDAVLAGLRDLNEVRVRCAVL